MGKFDEDKIDDVEQPEVVDTTLKYQNLIDNEGFPFLCPQQCQPVDRPSYRFVDTTALTHKQFLPTILVDKQNGISRKSADIKRCKTCAISLYDSEANARSVLNFLNEKQMGKWTLNLIAKGYINRSEGVSTDISTSGHFSFYEYKSADISKNFTVI